MWVRKVFIFGVLVGVSVIGMSGCFKVKTIVRVDPDGKGQIVESIGIRKDVLEMFQAFARQMGEKTGEEAKVKVPGMADEKTLRERAVKFGRGVQFVKAYHREVGDFLITTAIYAFRDINEVQLPEGQLPTEQMAGKPTPQKPDFITFRFRRLPDRRSELQIYLPKPPKPVKEPPKPKETQKPRQPEAMTEGEIIMATLMWKMMEGMEIFIAVECGGRILKTNATFQEGNRITLIRFSLDEVLKTLSVKEQKDLLKQLSKVSPTDPEQIKELMKHLKGVQLELNERVTLIFQ